MNKLFITFAASLLVANAVFGRTLSPDEALKRALGESASPASAVSHEAGLRLVFTGETLAADEAATYVFSSEKGFLVLSADDCAAPILGYSDSSAFDAENIPENVRWWLGEYASQIEYGRARGLIYSASAQNRQPVAPLMSTKWNQSEPFNNLCPLYNGQRCVTGCVATAMAQVLNYHRYPVSGQGTKTYTASSIGKTVTCDFASYTFDWNNMLDTYDTYTSAQATAVAQLMFAVGAASEMNYTPVASGASSQMCAEGIVKYLGLGGSVNCVERSNFTTSAWEEMVYNQISTVGPLYYSGSNSSAGHAFVCDGYSSDGFFHFNWGWGGMSDGYFRLDALDPDSQGIGGSAAGYNCFQTVITGVCDPARNVKRVNVVAVYSTFEASVSSAQLGSKVSFKGGVINCNYQGTVTATVGVKFENVNDGTNRVLISDIMNLKLDPQYYSTSNFSVTVPSGLAEGEYIVSPVVRIAGSDGWAPMQPLNTMVGTRIVAKVTGGRVIFTSLSPASLEAQNVKILTPTYVGSPFLVSCDVVNKGDEDFYGLLGAAFCTTSGSYLTNSTYFTSGIPAGETAHFEFTAQPGGSMSAGNYLFGIVNFESNKFISDGIPFTLKAKSGIAPALTLTGLAVENAMNVTDASKLTVTGTVRNTGGFYGDGLIFAIFKRVGNTWMNIYQKSRQFFIDDKSTEALAAVIDASSALESNSSYLLGVYWIKNNSATNLSQISFNTKTLSAVDEVMADAAAVKLSPNPVETTAEVSAPFEITSVGVYDLSGRRVQTPVMIDGSHAVLGAGNLSSGHYIIKVEGDAHSDMVRMIKR